MIVKQFTTMAMPCILSIADIQRSESEIESAVKEVISFLDETDNTFSPFKKLSEISKINAKKLKNQNASIKVQYVLSLCEQTRHETNGYFSIVQRNGKIDPCGLVKGWAINQSAQILRNWGFSNFMIEIAGDIQTSGTNEFGEKWTIGIRNPLKPNEIIKTVGLSGEGIATSGTYLQGNHIYDPIHKKDATEILSLSVIGSNIYDADRFATAAFAMGQRGIEFIEARSGLEGYMIDKNGIATFTSGFSNYVKEAKRLR